MSEKEYVGYYLETPIFNGFDENISVQQALGSGRAKVLQEAGDWQSANFITGSGGRGWRLRANGDFEGSSGTFRGSVTVASIDIPDTTTANSFHVNSSGDTWWGATAIGSAVAKVLKTGVATFTDIVATGTVNATGGFIGSSTALVFESTGVNVGTTGHVRGGQTDYATGTGFFLGYSGGQYKFSIGDSTNYLKWDGTTLTYTGRINVKSGTFSKDMTTTTTTTIAHGLGRTPQYIKITCMHASIAGGSAISIFGIYDGTSQNCIYIAFTGNGNNQTVGTAAKFVHYSYDNAAAVDADYNEGTASFDSTNITITWSLTGVPVGTAQFLWEAY